MIMPSAFTTFCFRWEYVDAAYPICLHKLTQIRGFPFAQPLTTQHLQLTGGLISLQKFPCPSPPNGRTAQGLKGRCRRSLAVPEHRQSWIMLDQQCIYHIVYYSYIYRIHKHVYTCIMWVYYAFQASM